MSTSEAAGYDAEDCPLCLEPLPPFWEINRPVVTNLMCCAKEICNDCYDKRQEFLWRAVVEGTVGREERQLDKTCPLCRAEIFNIDMNEIVVQQFNDGHLPLKFYCGLAVCYLKGAKGVEMNAEKGAEILMLGAEEGEPRCQGMLGNIYHKGGVYCLKKSREEAKRWYMAAAEQGHAIAEFNLSTMMGEEGNDAEYLRYTMGSASKGFDKACFNLGTVYSKGSHGLEKSVEEAIRWWTPAAERGHVEQWACWGPRCANRISGRQMISVPISRRGCIGCAGPQRQEIKNPSQA